MELYLCSLYIPSSPGQGQIYVLPFVGTRGAGTVGNFRVFCLSDLSVEVSIYAKRPVSGLGAEFLIFPCLSTMLCWLLGAYCAAFPMSLLCCLVQEQLIHLCNCAENQNSTTHLGFSHQLLMFLAFLCYSNTHN